MLPNWHDRVISDLMNEQGIGRSEAVRLIVREWQNGSLRMLRHQLRQKIVAIKGHIQIAKGNSGMMGHALAEIERALEEISRMTGADGIA